MSMAASTRASRRARAGYARVQMLVAVVRLDVPSPPLVRDATDRANERKVLGLGRDSEELAGLKVDRHLDREAGIAVESLVSCHQPRTLFTPSVIGRAPAIASRERRGSVRAMLLSGITSLGKTVLLIVAITFIVWAIVTAIFVPKRNPGFPRRLDAYILVSAILFLAQMTAIVWVSETQEVEEAHAAEGEGGAPGDGRRRRAARRRRRRQGGLRERRLRDVPHACRRRRERHRRARSRRPNRPPSSSSSA